MRRGYVVMIRGGDAEISAGIAEGMMKVEAGKEDDLIRQCYALPPTPKGEGKGTRGTSSDPARGRATFPNGGRLLEAAPPPLEHVEVVEAEIDRQRIQRALLRVAVGNHNTAEDYRNMMTKARGDYAVTRRPGPLGRLGEQLLKVYALAVLACNAAYRAQDLVLGRR